MAHQKRTKRQKTEIAIDLEDSIAKSTKQSWSNKFRINQQFVMNDVHRSFYDTLMLPNTKMAIVDGRAGTAKTYLAALAALKLLQNKEIENIVYIRSIIESASKSIGSLPGELEEKFHPWAMPLIEKLDEIVGVTVSQDLIKNEIIKCVPINFARGLTFKNSFVIVDEIQNFCFKEILTCLSRFGHGTKYAVIGDSMQSDINGKSGFSFVFNRFNDEESQLHGIHTFKFGENEVVRSEILKFIVKKLEINEHIKSASTSLMEHSSQDRVTPEWRPQQKLA